MRSPLFSQAFVPRFAGVFILTMATVLFAMSSEVRATNSEIVDLHTAARMGSLESVKDFVSQGADVNSEDAEHFTPLIYAAANDHIDIAAYLLGKGADPNLHSSESGATALLLSSQMGHARIVKLLLDKGGRVNATDNLGMTPLIRAAYSCKDAIVEILLNRGADVNWKDTLDETALNVAERKYKKFVMLDTGRNIDRKNFRKRYERIIDLLKKHGGH